jgi:2-hydroxychromene-2-carboxylate isomerase
MSSPPLPAVFPQNSLRAARLALIGGDEGWIGPFTRAIFEAEFVHGADIADTRFLDTLLRSLHLDSERLLSRIAQPDIKVRLERRTAEAQQRGIFGAPSFICGGELFWGDDRLEQALAWAARH